jgi:hypothetical protein
MMIALGVAAGCRKKGDEAVPPAQAGSTGPASSSTPDAAAPAVSGTATGSPGEDGGSAPPAPEAAFLPAKLGEKQGVILADTRGGTVEGIADGTVVDIGEMNEAMMGSDESSTASVTAGGKTVTVPMIHLLREASMQRSPDGKFAVLSQIESCGDLCHSMHFIVAADGRRARLGDGVVDIVVAWKKDGTEVAVGSGHLWIIALDDLTVRKVESYTAPAYGADGMLYARDHDGSAFIVAGAAAPRRVWKAPPKEPSEDDEYGADDPDPVRFDDKGVPIYEPEYVGPPGGE